MLVRPFMVFALTALLGRAASVQISSSSVDYQTRHHLSNNQLEDLELMTAVEANIFDPDLFKEALHTYFQDIGWCSKAPVWQSIIEQEQYEDDSYTAKGLPVVIMHGMGDAAAHDGMQRIRKALSKHLGVYTVNIAIGNSTSEDEHNSYFMNLDDQIGHFTHKIRKDPQLVNGFNAIGFSQGNLIIRGYIERYNTPPVKNWISVHGPLGGIAELPSCKPGDNLCKRITELIGSFAYSSWVQNHVTQSNFFRDPMRIADYKAKARFLPDINNERANTTNATYAKRFESLNRLVLVKALKDTTVIPPESEWFGMIKDGNFSVILQYNETEWYKDNLFGLRSLYEADKISFHTTNSSHMKFQKEELFSWVDKYFN